MTMPAERTRSLRWAHELLSALVAADDLSDEIRDRARLLCSSFPGPEAVQSLIASNADRLPVEIAQAIEQARVLFVDVQLSGCGSEAIRNNLLYTLRHFPTPGSAASIARDRFAFGIESWLARDTGGP